MNDQNDKPTQDNDERAADSALSASPGSVNLGDVSPKKRLKGVTRNGAYYALNDIKAEVVPLAVAEELYCALTTTLECLEMNGFGKAYAEQIARKTLDEIHSQNNEVSHRVRHERN